MNEWSKTKTVVTILEEAIQISYNNKKVASMQTIWEYLNELRAMYFNKIKNIYQLLDLMIIDYMIMY